MKRKFVESRTERLLQSNPDLRNSDKKLLLAFWESEGLYLSEAQRYKFFGCTPAESITRARRALKAQYPASKAVDQGRFEQYVETKQEYSFNKPLENAELL